MRGNGSVAGLPDGGHTVEGGGDSQDGQRPSNWKFDVRSRSSGGHQSSVDSGWPFFLDLFHELSSH